MSALQPKEYHIEYYFVQKIRERVTAYSEDEAYLKLRASNDKFHDDYKDIVERGLVIKDPREVKIVKALGLIYNIVKP